MSPQEHQDPRAVRARELAGTFAAAIATAGTALYIPDEVCDELDAFALEAFGAYLLQEHDIVQRPDGYWTGRS